MPTPLDLPHEVGVLLSLLPDDEEGGGHAGLLERVQYGWSARRVGAVVEGQRNAARARGAPDESVREHAEIQPQDTDEDEREVGHQQRAGNEDGRRFDQRGAD
jgi:hypothetical protein